MKDIKIISPCISICKNDPKTDLCFGCARSIEEKKIWKLPETTNAVSYTHLTLPTKA